MLRPQNSAGGFTGSVGLNVVQQLPASKWRNIIYSQWVLIGLAIGSAIYIPESPRWLVGKGKTDRARKVLERVYGNCPHYDIDVELQRMVMEVDYAKKEKGIRASGGYLDLFKGTNFVSILTRMRLQLTRSVAPRCFYSAVPFPGQRGHANRTSCIYTCFLEGLMLCSSRPKLTGGRSLSTVHTFSPWSVCPTPSTQP